MGMWWETAAVMGVMVGVVQAFYGIGILKNYGHAGKSVGRGAFNKQQMDHMTRDRDNSYPTWLSTRQRRQGVDDGNNYFQYGLEKLPPTTQ